MKSRGSSSVDKALARWLWGHEFDSRRGLRFFLCLTLVSCSLFYLCHFIAELKIHHHLFYYHYCFLFQLSIDQLYLTAIRNLARPSSGSTAASDPSDPNISGVSAGEDPSQLAKSYNSEKAKTMLYSIKNKEMAIAAAKWIAQQLPLGKWIVFVFFLFFLTALNLQTFFLFAHSRCRFNLTLKCP